VAAGAKLKIFQKSKSVYILEAHLSLLDINMLNNECIKGDKDE